MIEPKDSSEQYRGKTVRKSSRSVSQVGNQVVSGVKHGHGTLRWVRENAHAFGGDAAH